MCRMFGMVATQAVSPRELLHDAPRSLRALSVEHGDGWGIALAHGDWQIHKSISCAARCTAFPAIVDSPARVVVAHVRKKTVGDLALANTHPFRRGELVFAHNGTVAALSALTSQIAPAHLAEIEGDTDSEKLFAFVLTHIDAAGDLERGVVRAIRALQALGEIGSANFLLASDSRVYAYRQGRSLYTLARDAVAIVASERLTDEDWIEVPERALVILGDLDVAAETVRVRSVSGAAH
ncbi:MAG TPA: class II glutamine amidotransferase [Kofleriaceae bacterium]|jgi:glutamine amidotransferase|nr:class II glutamine amidotransferase [Kofleriaceae bacterium]